MFNFEAIQQTMIVLMQLECYSDQACYRANVTQAVVGFWLERNMSQIGSG